jgi:dTMP kinase
MNTAKIIVVDGGANIGKATQADMLMNRLINEGYKVGKMDFPRYNQNTVGHFINEFIDSKNPALDTLPPKAFAVLFAADRYESKKQIEEWIAEGRVIIFDRYVSASMLHQGSKITDIDAREEFLRWVEHVEYEIFGMPRPHLTIYLDVPPNESDKLLGYVEELGVKVVTEEGTAKIDQAKVSDCAKYLAAMNHNWVTIPCLAEGNLRNRDDIHEEVYAAVKEKILTGVA